MGLAETVELAVRIGLHDDLSPGVTKINRNLGTFEKGVGRVGKGVKTIGANLKSAFTTPLGLIGITGGIFALGSVFTETIGKAQEFGNEINRLSKLTGLGTAATAGLALEFEHYGIDATQAVKITALLEKNVGNLTATKKKATEFEKTYGLALVDANGKVKDANQLLLDSADYFNNKAIPAQTKAAALAKIFGRSWADLIPLLGAGSVELKKIQDEASRAGLGDLAKAAAENKTAMRDWSTTVSLLELAIGTKLLPKITALTKTATEFVGQHSDEIIQFFEDGAKFAGEMGAAIHDDVLPVFSAIGTVWSKIPPDLKKLLIGGFVLNKLSGGAITDIASELAKGAIKGVLGIQAGVVNVEGAVVNGGGGIGSGVAGPPGPPGAAGAAGGASVLSFASTAALAGLAQEIGIAVTDAMTTAVTPVFAGLVNGNQQAIDQFTGTLDKIQIQFLPGAALPQNIAKLSDAVNAFLSGKPVDGGGSPGGSPQTGTIPVSDSGAHQMLREIYDRNKAEHADGLKTPKQVLTQLKKDGIDLGAIHRAQVRALALSAATTAAINHKEVLKSPREILAGLAKNGIDLNKIHAAQVANLTASRTIAADIRHDSSSTGGKLNTANSRLGLIARKKTNFIANTTVNVATRVSVSELHRQARYASRVARTTHLSAS